MQTKNKETASRHEFSQQMTTTRKYLHEYVAKLQKRTTETARVFS